MDSYELLFQVKSAGEETLVKLYSSIRDIDNAGKGASQSVDGIGASMGKAAAPTSQLSAELRAAVAAINQNTSSLASLTTALEGVTTTAPQTGAAIRGVGTNAMYASAALRELDGSLNMRSAGRFLAETLGLGSALKVLFPIVGAIAFAEILDQIVDKLGKVYNQTSPVILANQASLKILQDTSAEYDRIIAKTNRLRLDEYERAHGKEARQRLEAGEFDASAKYDDAARISYLQNQIGQQRAIIEAAKKEIASIGAEPQYPSEISGSLKRSSAGAETQSAEASAKLIGLEAKLQNAQAQQKLDLAEGSDIRAKADKENSDKRTEAAKKAAAEIAAAEKQASTILRDAQTYELSGLEKIIVKRRELLEQYGKTKKAIDDINAAMNLEQRREISKIQQDNRSALGGYLAGDGVSDIGKTKDKDFAKKLKESIANEEKEIRELQAAADRYDKADANAVRNEASKALRVSDLAAGNSSGSQGIANNNAYQIRLELAKQLFDIEARRIDRLDDEGEKEKALGQARLDYEDELDKARTDHELKYLELQKKDLDEVHNLASGFYDAIRRGGTGVQQFFSSQAQGIGKTLFSNAFTEGYKAIGSPSAGGLIPGQTGADGQLTTIGRILQGTPFGTNGKDAQSKTADNTLRTALGVERLANVLSGKDPNGSTGASSADNMPVPGMIGVTYADLGQMTQSALDATVTGTPSLSDMETFGDLGPASVANAAAQASSGSSVLAALTGASGYSGFMGSLGRFAQPGQGVGAVMDAVTGDSGDTGAQRAGVLVGAGTAAATGVMGVIQGIDQGGARGTLSAIGAGAGTIAAFDPEPISKSILASVAAGSALIKGLLGDPRQNRSLYEQRALRDDQYFAPPTISRTTDSSGNEVGYNFMGQAHSLPFQTFSEVMPYDKNYKMPFGSGVPNVWGEVPGQIIEPYTDPQNYKNDFSTPSGTNGGYAPAQTIVNLTVQAIDTQSFANFANKNSAIFASMTSKEIKNGHPVGMAIQQAVFGT